jgi:hypothetical protein
MKTATIGMHTSADDMLAGEDDDEEEEDVKQSHLYRILDQLQSRAIEIEDAQVEGQASLMGDNILTIRGSRFVYKSESDESGAVKSKDREDSPSPVRRVSPAGLSVPALKGPGLNKWRHLAAQLQLPLEVVMLAARQRISDRFFK